MLVRELMTQKVEWTTADTTLATAARRMRDLNIGCLPVGDGDSFIGMLTEKDFTSRATAEGLNPTTTTVSQIMTSVLPHPGVFPNGPGVASSECSRRCNALSSGER